MVLPNLNLLDGLLVKIVTGLSVAGPNSSLYMILYFR